MTTAHQGTFNVVIPCYNYGHYLPSCVRSIVEQPGVDVEVLIIDDCSTDGSAAVAVDLGRQYANVSVVCHEVNQGHVATYNEGIDWATGDYFILISSDDLLAEGSLERARAVFDEHPNVGLVYGPVAPFATEADIGEQQPATVTTTIAPGRRWIRQFCRIGENLTRSPEVVLRTSVQKTIGHYDARLGHAGDMHMWLRAAMISDVAHVRGGVQAFYRIHGQNMSRTMFAARLEQLRQLQLTFTDAFASATDPRAWEHEERMAQVAVAKLTLWEGSKAYQHGTPDEEFDPAPYIELARQADPHVTRRLAYWGLRLRPVLGRRLSRVFPPFLVARASRLVRRRARTFRTDLRGI